MQVRKAVIGSAIGVGMGAALFAGAGSASADVSHGWKPPTKPSSTTTITNSFNKDDHSINVLNGVNVLSGVNILSGNKTSISVLNGNKFLNNLGSGANILNFSTNLHNSVTIWTKVGNGNTGLATP